ncbi:glycosyltransferase [Mesobacterium sp. TK19101]|uniref:Glycosyltransferase n=1 Tax=Mesobacterium hydrothermale TaxID=3111907 RepID=A0ABU6HJL0_9RHOB|nr:glycosyltransferase [Mesobacterium sp. TK19101]MEC3862654.1 glycosyltransferase [Mesobacterium sp. TK19101]
MSHTQRLPEPVRALLRPVARMVRKAAEANNPDPYKGVVDGVNSEGMLRGWVFDRRTRKGYVSVGLFLGDTLLESGTAQYQRDDVAAALGAEPTCGFQFMLSEKLVRKVAENGGILKVRTIGDQKFEIGEVELKMDTREPSNPGDATIVKLAHALRDDVLELLDLLDDVPDDAGAPAEVIPAPFEKHALMFTTERVIPDIPLSGQPAYLDYVRYRYRMDESYEVAPGLESSDRFIYWYLTAYRAHEKRRVPLSRDLIAYLNEPIVMGGQTYSMSRIMWWRMAGRPDLLSSTNLNDRDSYLNTLFWWAHQDCTHMYFEDCLVPDRFADFLRGIHPSRRLDAYPLSYFTERYFLDTPSLHVFDPGSPEGRKALALSMLVKAVRRPDLLRYIPHGILGKLLTADKTGVTELERFVNALLATGIIELPVKTEDKDTAEDGSGNAKDAKASTKASTKTGAGNDVVALASVSDTGADDDDSAGQDDALPHVALSRERYAHALRKKDFDLASYRFLTISPNGDRFESAAIPRPDAGEEVDVQLIGPLAKASGLGQATRLSAEILRETGLSIRGVDFDLDNPAPEGFSSDTMIEDYGPAKINIIHLNAESIPLAFAYQPDVFSGRYNIGYFFWELDQPAYCHYLGMEMLDEMWVSTEYGVEIYTKDEHGKPVINVGMCYEDTPGITREDARAFVNRRFLFNDKHYVCLVAFDSFSFVQRKNPVSVLEAFQKAFKGVPNARLVVKTQNRDSVFDAVQVQLWDRVDSIVASDPRIVVMNETLSYRDLLRLKAGSDCYITLHKSEGWGFGMIEAMNLGVPVVCTAYSGNMDFCSDETAWLVEYEESLLKQGDYIFVRKGSKWAEPSVEHAAKQLRAAYDNPEERLARAKAAQDFIHKEFSSKAIAKRYGGRLREILETLGKAPGTPAPRRTGTKG